MAWRKSEGEMEKGDGGGDAWLVTQKSCSNLMPSYGMRLLPLLVVDAQGVGRRIVVYCKLTM